jgi:hypothetical protein
MRTVAERRRVPREPIEDKKELHSGAESGILDNTIIREQYYLGYVKNNLRIVIKSNLYL